jgi:hypothetical protein
MRTMMASSAGNVSIAPRAHRNRPRPGAHADRSTAAHVGEVSDPALWPNERLSYELYGQALQARGQTAELLDGIVESWRESVTASYREQGLPAQVARAQARLELAMSRGLIHDLQATGDREAVDRAAEQFDEMYEVWIAERYPEIL